MPPRISSLNRVAGLIPLVVAGAACAGPIAPVSSSSGLDEVRIAAIQTPNGFGFERERARALFYQALELAEAGRHLDAAFYFDRLVERFPGSRYMPPALYDAAVCRARMGDDGGAAQRLERLVRQVAESRGTPRARLELASVYARLERWDRAERHLATLLGDPALDPRLRLEALVGRARLFLSMGRLPVAERLSREALAYVPAVPAAAAAGDAGAPSTAALHAEAVFVRAETYRLRAGAVAVGEGGERPRPERLSARGQLMLEAQRLYFEAVRRGDPRWSEEAGRRLGVLYRDLWNELPGRMPAPDVMAAAPPEGAAGRPAADPEVEALVRRGLAQAEASLRQLEALDQIPTEVAERVRAEIEGASRPVAPEPLGVAGEPRPSQDL